MFQKLPMIQKGPWKVWLAEGCKPGPILDVVGLLEIPLSGGENADTARLWTIHGGGRSTIYGAEAAGEKYCLKVFADRRMLTRLRTFLGCSKGRRAFLNGLQARERKIPVPAVYAYAEKTFGPTVVVMNLLEHATQMNLLLEDMLAQGAELTTDPVFLQMVESVARFTRHMHDQSVRHKDFSPRNVLVGQGTGFPRVMLIDLEDVVFSDRRSDFRDDIEHFQRKMARYISPAALEVFAKNFKWHYANGIGR